MQTVGYKLVRVSDDQVVEKWGGVFGRMPGVPSPIILPTGDHVHCPSIGTDYSGFVLAEWKASPDVEQVVQERERRLSQGFVYNFKDDRGEHRIGTTEQDMKGWQEVTIATQAAIALGADATAINIVTDTGPAVVTALEWQQVLLAAMQHRQSIWAASFALQAMPTIPNDYASDSYWP